MVNVSAVCTSRRKLLSNAVGLGLTAGGLFSNKDAQAAAECPSPGSLFFEQIGFAMNRAEVRFVDLALADKPDFKGAEADVREGLLAPLKEAEKYDLLLLVRHDQIAITKIMRAHKISATSYDGKEVRPPEAIVVKAEERCWEVFLSILLDTFGIDSTVKSNFWGVLKELQLDTVAEEIGRAARLKDWPRTTMLLRKFLTQISDPKALARLEKKIGLVAFERMLKTFASRFVPWLGWLVMAGALATSLHNNWPRLDKCK